MERNLQILHTQRKIWKSHNRNAICWDFYYVNDNKEVDPRNFDQVMRCLFCYNSLAHVFNPNKRKRKKLITYYKTWYEKFEKHVDSDQQLLNFLKK
jgi:hypothetical protein